MLYRIQLHFSDDSPTCKVGASMNDDSRRGRLKPRPLPLKRAAGTGEAPHGAAPAGTSSAQAVSPALGTQYHVQA
jgi:hypothetical protein